MTKALSRIFFVFKSPWDSTQLVIFTVWNTHKHFHVHSAFNETCFTSHFNIYLVLLTQTHPNKPHTHSLTHEHKLPMGLRREWDESGLVFHVWCEGFPASLLFGRLLCFRHTGNGSGSSEALLLFSSTNTNWHLLLPPTHSWCMSTTAEPVFVSGLTGEISGIAHGPQRAILPHRLTAAAVSHRSLCTHRNEFFYL